MKWILLFFLPNFVFANYLSIGESGEVINADSYRLGGTFQSSTAGNGGLNLGGFVDTGWTDDMSSRFLFGVGSLDFHVGASLKYVPFPDYENQPAIGVRSAFWVARIDSTSVTTLQIAPLVSKVIRISEGNLVSYFAIPVNFTFYSNKSSTGSQFTIGSEYSHPKIHNVQFAAELSLNLSKSESGFLILASIPFDNKSGFNTRSKR